MKDNILLRLKSIFKVENISSNPEILSEYLRDEDIGLIEAKLPKYVVWPENIKEIQQLIQLANEFSVGLVPTSSDPPRLHATSIARNENTIIVNFTKMKDILNIDIKNRGVMVEPGVNFGEFIEISRKSGFRPHLPLYPYQKKSVVGAALDREPILIPKYHWDISDPLLCTEVVFGSGDMFRTGAAAGPGSLAQQKESGGAQKNPMGPTQFSPFRLIQGAQGSIAFVSWATLKIERDIDVRKNIFITSEKLDENFDFLYEILKYRLGDEIFLLNNLNLAALIGKNSTEIAKIQESLPNAVGIISLTGTGDLAQDKIDWQIGDISEYADKFGTDLEYSLKNISDNQINTILEDYSPVPWRLKFKGGCKDILFITTLDQTPKFKQVVWEIAKDEGFETSNIGVYIQPIVQGCNVHCEFDLYYNPKDNNDIETVKNTFVKSSKALIDEGAFFNRPFGIWADMIYSKIQPEIVESMKKVKKIFDSNGILNPGVLCFKEGE